VARAANYCFASWDGAEVAASPLRSCLPGVSKVLIFARARLPLRIDLHNASDATRAVGKTRVDRSSTSASSHGLPVIACPSLVTLISNATEEIKSVETGTAAVSAVAKAKARAACGRRDVDMPKSRPWKMRKRGRNPV
jgi:hypothetical protein